jgi:hypothetical protein
LMITDQLHLHSRIYSDRRICGVIVDDHFLSIDDFRHHFLRPFS